MAEAAPRQRDAPYHHGNLRETLVDAGVELARTGGPDAVVLREVSRAGRRVAQRGVPALRRPRGPARRGRRAVHGQLGLLMTERTGPVTAARPVSRARARLEAIGRAYIDFALSEPGWFRTAFAGAPRRRHRRRPRDADPRHDPYTLLTARLDELVEVGALPPERRPGAE